MKNIAIEKKHWNFSLLGGNILLFSLAFAINDPLDLFNTTYASADPIVENISIDQVAGLEVYTGNVKKFAFTKKNTNWLVVNAAGQEYPADESRVVERLERILDARTYQLVTSNAERYAEFQVTDSDFSIVIAARSGNSERLYIGKNGSNFNSTLVRKETDSAVYSVKGNLKSDWNQSVSFFRDRHIIKFQANNLKSVNFTGPQNYLLQRDNQGNWTSTQSTNPLDANAINSHLESISSTIGLDFSEQPAETEKAYGVITFTFQNEVSQDLILRGPDSNNEYLAKNSAAADTLSLSKYKAESFFKELSSFELDLPAEE